MLSAEASTIEEDQPGDADSAEGAMRRADAAVTRDLVMLPTSAGVIGSHVKGHNSVAAAELEQKPFGAEAEKGIGMSSVKHDNKVCRIEHFPLH